MHHIVVGYGAPSSSQIDTFSLYNIATEFVSVRLLDQSLEPL